MLPKELEISGVLKKSFGTVMVLLFIPLFSTLIIDIALAFVDGVAVASVETMTARSITTLTSGLAASSLVPNGLGPISLAAKAGAGIIGATTSNVSDINVFTIGAWVVAFLFIIATPRIVSSVVFGTGSIAEGLLQKIPMGGGFAAAAVGMGMKSGAGAASDVGAARLSSAGAAVGSAVKRGMAGLSQFIR
jgi:hypothetical protein